MGDIVERLRNHITAREWPTLQDRAADEITRLRAELADYKNAAASEAERANELHAENIALCEENARLREVLKPFAARIDNLEKSPLTKHACAAMVEIEHLRAARDAIREGGKDD